MIMIETPQSNKLAVMINQSVYLNPLIKKNFRGSWLTNHDATILHLRSGNTVNFVVYAGKPQMAFV